MRFLTLLSIGWSAVAFAPAWDQAARQAAWQGTGITPGQARQSSVGFGNRTPEKSSGTIRIGIFGPSIACPSEVRGDEDVGTYLQRRFQEAGFDNVQVLTFGAGGAPIQQSYFIWDRWGRLYGLDHVHLMVPRLQKGRELVYLDFGRNRFVQTAGGWREVKPAEGLRGLWESLRFDISPPVLRGRLEPNPFYHRSDLEQETAEVGWYAIQRFQSDVKRFSLSFTYGPVADFAARAAREGVAFFTTDLNPLAKKYWISPAHLTPAGNRMRAEELFAYFTGLPEFAAGEPARTYRVQGRYPWPLRSPAFGKVVKR